MLTALDIINNFEQMSLLEMRKETGGDLKRLTTLALFKKGAKTRFDYIQEITVEELIALDRDSGFSESYFL